MKNDAQLALELLETIESRRRLEKREADLKSLFKIRMNNLSIDTITVGGVLISLQSKTRTSLDRKSLAAAFSEQIISKFEKISEYQQVDVKAVNAGSNKKAA